MRHVVDEDVHAPHSARIAADLGAGEAQAVAQHEPERLLRHHVDTSILTVDVQRDQAFDGAGRRRLAVHRRRSEQIGGRGGDRTCGNDALDEAAA